MTTNIRDNITTKYVGFFSVLLLSDLVKSANIFCNNSTVYQFCLDRNYLTTESAENTEKESREMNDSDVNRFDIIQGLG